MHQPIGCGESRNPVCRRRGRQRSYCKFQAENRQNLSTCKKQELGKTMGNEKKNRFDFEMGLVLILFSFCYFHTQPAIK